MGKQQSNFTSRDNLGFLLAKASQRWNELLYDRYCREGFAHVRPTYGSILMPLFEEDGLRMGELARRARLTKQTMTTMVQLMENSGLVGRQPDPKDGRATLVYLTAEAKRFQPVAEKVLAEMDEVVGEAATKEMTRTARQWLKAIMSL